MALKKSDTLCKIKAVILVGGPGTRLHPLTFSVPKPLVPVLNRPVMEHMIAYLNHFGVKDIILTLSYLPGAIREYFGDGRDFGVRLSYSMEKEPMGTSGAVKSTENHLDGTFFVLNGDIFTEMDLAEMYASHVKNKAGATIALTWVDNPGAFGVVETDKKNKVKRFIEKPPPGTETTNWINAGTYILEPEVLNYIPAGRHDMFEKGLFPRLLEAGEPVYGYPYRGYWLDMGTLEKYLSLNFDMLFSKVKSPLFHIGDNMPGVTIDPSAEIKAPVIMERDCRIGPGVIIKGPVSMGRGCIVEKGAGIERAVVWDNVRVGARARLKNCIVSSNNIIESGREVTDCVVTPTQTAPLLPQR
jgi:mannose-1-phosphate guanylyltransferase